MPSPAIPSFQVRYTPLLFLALPIALGILFAWSTTASALDPGSAVRESRIAILVGTVAATAILVLPFARTPVQVFHDRVVPSVPLLLGHARSIPLRRRDSVLRVVYSKAARGSLMYGLEVVSSGEPPSFVPLVARGARAKRIEGRLRERCRDLDVRVEEMWADERQESNVTGAILLAAMSGTAAFGLGAGLLVLGVSGRALGAFFAGNVLGVVAVLAYGAAWLWVRDAPARAFAVGATKPL